MGCFLLEGFLAMEMARVDTSISTFFGVQSGLAMGSIYLLGSEDQKNYWLPKMQQFEKIGAFGLTEPEVGSAAAGGLTTTVKREGDSWVLNGQKKWIGNAIIGRPKTACEGSKSTKTKITYLIIFDNGNFLLSIPAY
jgi:glutaryl-CoA dehydrogenase